MNCINQSYEIEVTITADGKTILHVQGIKGENCRGLTQKIEERLGTAEYSENTSEFYEREIETVREQTL